MAKDNDKAPVIIIKRVKKVDGGHHGGAWKVAYADFVTAMMAFFLLLWLLNVTTDKQKELISSYFAPADPRIAESTSGAGGVMGGTTISPDGAMSEDQRPVASPNEPSEGAGKKDETEELQKQIEAMDKSDEKAFKETEDKIRQAIESVPELKELSQNLLVDMTPEGLRIQMVDQEGKPMFELGSAKPLPAAEKLLQLISKVVQELPNKTSIRGHTDSAPYGKDASYTNWELSSDRANASRRVMLAAGLDVARLENVQGKADREPLVPEDPRNARNRRISIILLKQSIAAVAEKDKIAAERKKQQKAAEPEKPEPRKREEGVIYFP
jgi:chemotaxis protein MotB